MNSGKKNKTRYFKIGGANMSNFYGLIGEKLGHSFSPVINGLILKKINAEGTYNLFEIKKGNLKEAIQSLKILGCSGVNVTIPYKIEVMNYLDEISEEAAKIGAVNTVAFCNGKLKGYNTDYFGFGLTLKKYKIDVKNKSAYILGTGGVSKAVSRYLMDNGIKSVTYVSREANGHSKDNTEIISYDELKRCRGDIIINCTPCGMYPAVDNCPVDRSTLEKFDTAVDLIYNPEYTLFLKLGMELGLKTANGLYMLIAQNAASQNVWRGIDVPLEVIDEVYKEGCRLL